MKKLLLAGVAAVTVYGAAPANAAPQVFNWSGFYVGGNGGYARADDRVTHKVDFFSGKGTRFALTHPNGWFGGGQFGFNAQSGPVVAGLEIMFDAGRLKGDVTSPAFPGSDVWHSRIDGFVTTTARFGYSFGMWMPYVKAGWAWGRVTSSADCLSCTPPELWKNTQWQNGGTIGAGIEAMLGGNWIIGIEYDYIDLSSKHHGGTTSGTGVPVNVDETSRINMILGRLSYLFGSH